MVGNIAPKKYKLVLGVLEVSYSQNYILKSNGNIKAVIGFDINYGETKESTVSLWRPLYIQEDGEELDMLDVRQEIRCQPFRAPDGIYVNQTQHIRLNLRDFAPDRLSADVRGLYLEISYEKLAEFLRDAEEMRQTRELGDGIKSDRKTRKRKYSSSSVEEMKTEDEAEHRLRETEDAERSAARDTDYNPLSRKRRI
ncbi:hypothetical protein BJX66DRAFT_324582 [Aspergillus keveii]|uniref:Uncharacterized protein n=1 Tax=Aspergillus keveii TaxID=714993 RepID=A0ABR4G901_9EURO